MAQSAEMRSAPAAAPLPADGVKRRSDSVLSDPANRIRASSVRPGKVQPENTAFRRDAFMDVTPTTGAETPGMPKGERKPDMEEYVRFSEGTKDEHRAWLEGFASTILSQTDSSTPGGKEKLRAMPYAEDALKILGVADKKLGTEEYNTAIHAGVDKLLSTPEGWMYAETLMEQETDLMESTTGFAIESLPAAQRDIVGKELEGIYRRIYTGEGEGLVHKIDIKAARAIHDHWKKIATIVGVDALPASVVGAGVATLSGTGIGALAGAVTALGIGTGYGIWGSAHTPGETITRTPSADRLESIKRNPALVEYMKLKGVDVNDFNIVDGRVVAVAQNSTMRIGEMVNAAMSNRMTRKHFLTELGIPPSEQDITDVQGYLNNAIPRTGERRAKMVKDRFDALGGRETRATGHGAGVDGFMGPGWADKHKAPSAEKLGLPDYDPSRLRPQEDATDVNGNRKVKDTARGAFWGKGVAGVKIGEDLSSGPSERDLLAHGRIRVVDGSPDEWGQKKGDAGYGVEKREARRIIGRIGREKTAEIRATGNHTPDKLGNVSERSIGFARIDGREIKLPERPYPGAIAMTWDSDHPLKFTLREVSEPISWTDSKGVWHETHNRRDIWEQNEYFDRNRLALEQSMKDNGVNTADIDFPQLSQFSDIQRIFNTLHISDDQVTDLTAKTISEAIEKAEKTIDKIAIANLMEYVEMRKQIDHLGISDRQLDTLDEQSLERFISGAQLPSFARRDAILKYASYIHQRNILTNSGISESEILAGTTPDLVKNRFFGIIDIRNLKDVDGNPIPVRDEQMFVNTGASGLDADGQEPNALFYKIFDGRRVALPDNDTKNLRRIYRPVRRGMKIVGHSFDYDSKEDIWGQKPGKPGQQQSNDASYFASFNAASLPQYTPYKNVDAKYLVDRHDQGFFEANPELTDVNPDKLNTVYIRGLVRQEQALSAVMEGGIPEQMILGFANIDAFRTSVRVQGMSLDDRTLDEITNYVRFRGDLSRMADQGITEQLVMSLNNVADLQDALASFGLVSAPPNGLHNNADALFRFIHNQHDLSAMRSVGISDSEIRSLSPENLRQRVRDSLQQKNAYFARREKTETGKFTPEHFDKKYWVDQWNQPYFLPNGERNWFFGKQDRAYYLNRANAGLPTGQRLPTGLGEVEGLPINLDLFSPRDFEDTMGKWPFLEPTSGRELPNENIGRGDRPFRGRAALGRAGRGGRAGPTPGESMNTSREYFTVTADSPAEDNKGRKENDARFGLTDAQITQALQEYRNDPDRTPAQQDAINRLLTGGAIYDTPALVPNYDLFNWRTGRDVFDQWPWDPMFCRAPGSVLIGVERTVAGFQYGVDRRGRKNGDGGFGTGANPESGDVDVPVTLDRLRRARTEVIMFYGERLVSTEYKNPHVGEYGAITSKIGARTEGGEALERRRTEISRDKPIIEQSRAIVEEQQKVVKAYHDAEAARAKAAQELRTYLQRLRYPSVADAKSDIQSKLWTGQRSVSSRLSDIDSQESQEEATVYAQFSRRPGERETAYEQRIKPKLDAIELKYAGLRKPIEAEQRRLIGQETQIESYEAIMDQKNTELQAGSELSRNYDSATGPRDRDLDRFVPPLRVSELGSNSLSQLLTRINGFYTAGTTATPAPAFSWPAGENAGEEHLNPLLSAMIEAKARIAAGTGGGSRIIPNQQEREQAIRELREQLGRDITRVDRQVSTVSAEADLAKLQPAIDLLDNLPNIMKNKRDDLISDPEKYFPVKKGMSAEGAVTYDELLTWKDLEDNERSKAIYTPEEQDFMDATVREADAAADAAEQDLRGRAPQGMVPTAEAIARVRRTAYAEKSVPVAYLGVLHLLFDYQNPENRIYTDPARKETRGSYFKKISELLSPQALFDLLRFDERRTDQRIAINGKDLNEVLTNFQKSLRLVGGQDASRLAWNRADEMRIVSGAPERVGGVMPIGDGDLRLLIEDISGNLAKSVNASVS